MIHRDVHLDKQHKRQSTMTTTVQQKTKKKQTKKQANCFEQANYHLTNTHSQYTK